MNTTEKDPAPAPGIVQKGLNYETGEVEKSFRCADCADGSDYDPMTEADGVQPCLYCKRPVSGA